MIPILKFGRKYFKNRKRFDEIISDKRFPYLKSIYDRLLSGDGTLTDDEILTAYFKFSDLQQSNSYAIAELELVVISVPCYFRPSLSDKLLERPLLAIISSLGDKADYYGVTKFIDDYILKRNIEPYGGLPQKQGTDWLVNLKSNKGLIEGTLKRMWKQNSDELER
jgi:hypothetical protein